MAEKQLVFAQRADVFVLPSQFGYMNPMSPAVSIHLGTLFCGRPYKTHTVWDPKRVGLLLQEPPAVDLEVTCQLATIGTRVTHFGVFVDVQQLGGSRAPSTECWSRHPHRTSPMHRLQQSSVMFGIKFRHRDILSRTSISMTTFACSRIGS